MNFRLPAVIAAIGCVLFASCSPYKEKPDKKVTKNDQEQKSVSSPEQQKIKKQRDEMKEKQAAATTEQSTTPDTTKPDTTTAETTSPPKPVEEKRPEWKFANKVPGKDGYVFSPYNNKVVDVKGIPSGTLVQDPTYTGEGKGYFRVP